MGERSKADIEKMTWGDGEIPRRFDVPPSADASKNTAPATETTSSSATDTENCKSGDCGPAKGKFSEEQVRASIKQYLEVKLDAQEALIERAISAAETASTATGKLDCDLFKDMRAARKELLPKITEEVLSEPCVQGSEEAKMNLINKKLEGQVAERMREGYYKRHNLDRNNEQHQCLAQSQVDGAIAAVRYQTEGMQKVNGEQSSFFSKSAGGVSVGGLVGAALGGIIGLFISDGGIMGFLFAGLAAVAGYMAGNYFSGDDKSNSAGFSPVVGGKGQSQECAKGQTKEKCDSTGATLPGDNKSKDPAADTQVTVTQAATVAAIPIVDINENSKAVENKPQIGDGEKQVVVVKNGGASVVTVFDKPAATGNSEQPQVPAAPVPQNNNDGQVNGNTASNTPTEKSIDDGKKFATALSSLSGGTDVTINSSPLPTPLLKAGSCTVSDKPR